MEIQEDYCRGHRHSGVSAGKRNLNGSHVPRRPVDEALAAEIREFRSPTDGETRMFYEIVIAPGYTPEGLAKLKGKSKTLRILEAPLRPPLGRSLRQVTGAHALS